RVGDGIDRTAGLVPRTDRRVPARGVPDADRRGDGLRVRHRLAVHERRRAGRLPSEHARLLGDDAVARVLAIAGPVRGDVAGVADRDAVHVGRLAEHVADLPRRGPRAFGTA